MCEKVLTLTVMKNIMTLNQIGTKMYTYKNAQLLITEP